MSFILRYERSGEERDYRGRVLAVVPRMLEICASFGIFSAAGNAIYHRRLQASKQASERMQNESFANGQAWKIIAVRPRERERPALFFSPTVIVFRTFLEVFCYCNLLSLFEICLGFRARENCYCYAVNACLFFFSSFFTVAYKRNGKLAREILHLSNRS